jgi:hypothetical protein
MKAAGTGDMLVRTFRLVEQKGELNEIHPLACLACAFAVRTGKVTIVLIAFCVNVLACWQVSLSIAVWTLIQDPDFYHCTSLNKKPADVLAG